jgi:hypothetical protein
MAALLPHDDHVIFTAMSELAGESVKNSALGISSLPSSLLPDWFVEGGRILAKKE